MQEVNKWRLFISDGMVWCSEIILPFHRLSVTSICNLEIFSIVTANLTLIGGKDLELMIYSPIQDMYLCFNRSRLVGRQMVSTSITNLLFLVSITISKQ